MKPDLLEADVRDSELEPGQTKSTRPSPEDAQLAMSLLEADQLVAAKRWTRFGRRSLSLKVHVLLWGLRLYVIVMLLIVLMSVLRALHGAH